MTAEVVNEEKVRLSRKIDNLRYKKSQTRTFAEGKRLHEEIMRLYAKIEKMPDFVINREGEEKFGAETEAMLKSRRGYNCESYGEFYGPQPFKKVLEHEVEDMYNVHVLEETCRGLGIKCRGLEDPTNVRVWTEAAEREIECRFGADSKAIWLGTRPNVRTRYCTPGEKPVEYVIPRGAMVMSDLGSDGALFLFPVRGAMVRT